MIKDKQMFLLNLTVVAAAIYFFHIDTKAVDLAVDTIMGTLAAIIAFGEVSFKDEDEDDAVPTK